MIALAAIAGAIYGLYQLHLWAQDLFVTIIAAVFAIGLAGCAICVLWLLLLAIVEGR